MTSSPLPPPRTAVIVGSGIFGVSTALALRRRYLSLSTTSPHSPHLYSTILLLDQSPTTPSPLSASSDLNRIIRADYSNDLLYTHLALQAIDQWHTLNSHWSESVYHETGLLMLTERSLEEESYEYQSFQCMMAEGVKVERLKGQVLCDRFPMWGESGRYVDGYYNPKAGWVDNHRATQLLLHDAKSLGIQCITSSQVRLREDEGGRVEVVGKEMTADLFIFCCGAWTPSVLSYTSKLLRPSPQPVIYLQPPSSLLSSLTPSTFPVVACSLASSGYYIFPPSTRSLPGSSTASPVIKAAHHGPGLPFDDPSGDRSYDEELAGRMERHMKTAVPVLESCERVGSRMCYYCDATDGNFLMDRHPKWDKVWVMSGDSGHGFKFGPVIGDVMVGIMTEDKAYAEMRERFKWRETGGTLDAARSQVSFS